MLVDPMLLGGHGVSGVSKIWLMGGCASLRAAIFINYLLIPYILTIMYLKQGNKHCALRGNNDVWEAITLVVAAGITTNITYLDLKRHLTLCHTKSCT